MSSNPGARPRLRGRSARIIACRVGIAHHVPDGGQCPPYMETNLQQAERTTLSRTAMVTIVIFALAGLVRVYDLGVRGLWEDEFYSLAGSAGRYPDQTPIRLNQVMRALPAWTD